MPRPRPPLNMPGELLASPAHAALALPPADASRARYTAHNERIARRASERAAVLADKKRGARPGA